jgi:ABC-type glycerol-3-phosphate transport system permease component
MMENMLKKIKRNIKVSYVILFIILFVYTVSLLTPLLWTLLTSFKNVDDWNWALVQKDASGVVWTKSFEFSNYVEAYKNFYVERVRGGLNYRFYITDMFINSVLYAGGCAFFATITPCLAAYLCARYRYKFGKIAYTVVLITMAIPIVGSLPSEIQMVKNIGLYDNIFGLYILKANFLGMYFLIFYAQFKMIPQDYTSAAEIDGASEARIMLQVIWPLAIGTITTVFLLNFINFWNDYQIPMIYWDSHPVAAFGMFEYSRKTGTVAATPRKLAGILIMAVPILIVFGIFNKKIMSNMSIGGIKG